MRILGNCRVEAFCFDGVTRLAHVRGKFRKKVWINKDDIILVGLRDYQDSKADVIHKFSSDEARQLKAMGELPERAGVDESIIMDDDEDLIEFNAAVNYESEESEEEEEEDEYEDEDVPDLDDL